MCWGLLVAWLAGRLPESTVQVVDTNPARAEMAQALGARFALPEQAEPGAQLVFHTSAQAAGLATALRQAAASGLPACINVSLAGEAAPVFHAASMQSTTGH